VGREQHGVSPAGEAVDLPPEVPPRLDVHRRGRLVQNQQQRVARDRGGEPDPLRLPARQPVGAPPEQRLQVGEAHQVAERQRPGVQAAHHGEQLADPHAGHQAGVLEHGADQPAGDRL
jgi:hypothetical protein